MLYEEITKEKRQSFKKGFIAGSIATLAVCISALILFLQHNLVK